MSAFERELPSFRLVATHFGDDLQAVAARELGDANRWPELVFVNGLVPPYITDDTRQIGAGVVLSGAFIKVPAPGGWQGTSESERGQVYERDCKMVKQQLQVDAGGDFDILAGADNLRQQLGHRIATPRGQARRHPEYGCLIYRLLGRSNGPESGMLGGQYVKSALAADYRVKTVDYAQVTIIGDVINVQAKATAIEGGIVDLIQGARV